MKGPNAAEGRTALGVTFTFDEIVDAVARARLTKRPLDGIGAAPDESFGDYAFWRSPTGRRAFLVAPVRGALAAVELQPPQPSRGKRNMGMCNVCLTVHPSGGLGLWTNRVRRRGGLVVGEWVCRDFECKDRVGGRLRAPAAQQLRETITLEERHARMVTRIELLMLRYVDASSESS